MLFCNVNTRVILSRTFTTVVLIVCIISVTFYIPGSPYIRCVQCSSDESLSCIDDPPDPISCLKKEKFCQTVIKMNKSGSVLSLLRDCASISSEDCIGDGDDIIVCTNTCTQPGCNRGNNLLPSFLFFTLISLPTCYFCFYFN